MVVLILNNEWIFNKNILDILKDTPELYELFESSFDYLDKKNISGENVKIANNSNGSPKEIYDVLYNDEYAGNVFLFYEDITEFWSIYILIFPEYRKKGYSKCVLENLLNLYPERNWEANISEKNKSAYVLQTYLLEFGFETLDLGEFNSGNENVFNYKKAKNKIITVIASAYLQPISDLLNNLLKRSAGKINEVQTSQLENGYSVALCILLVACFESYLMRDFYFRKVSEKISVFDFIKKYFVKFPLLQEITECYIIRNLLLHNHIWEIEHSYYELKKINSSIMPFSGNSDFNKNVDKINLVTNKLKLNVNPIRINRNDVKTVFKVIWDSLNYFSKNKDSQIYFTNTTVFYNGQVSNFKEVYKIFMERV